MGANNARLDFLRFKDGAYVSDAFGTVNPSVQGLGDVGNDIAVHGDEVWIVVNNSGIVEVLSAESEKEIAAIEVPTPRNVAFDDRYAYVTSWAGAYTTLAEDYSLADYSNPKGRVYRIDLTTKALAGTVEVGYQPEGIACRDGKLYVANSGGISCQLPPDYQYENTLSIIDTQSFTVEKTVAVALNLKNVYTDTKGHVFVTSLGDYFSVHTGLYVLDAAAPEKVGQVLPVLGDGHVTCSFLLGDEVYCIGTDNEYEWNEEHEYRVWSCHVRDGSLSGEATFYPGVRLTGVPYGMAVVDGPSEGLHLLLVGDALDYFNPGALRCYQLDYNQNAQLWQVEAGVCPGHFALW